MSMDSERVVMVTKTEGCYPSKTHPKSSFDLSAYLDHSLHSHVNKTEFTTVDDSLTPVLGIKRNAVGLIFCSPCFKCHTKSILFL